MQEVRKVEISNKNIFMFFAIIAMIWLFFKAQDIIFALFASFVIASALFPAVEKMNKKMPRWLAVTIVFTSGLVALTVLLIPFFTLFMQQLQDFLLTLPQSWDKAVSFFIQDIESENSFLKDYLPFLPDPSQLVQKATEFGKTILDRSITLTINLFSGIVAIFTFASVILFLLLDKDRLETGFLQFFRVEQRDHVKKILESVYSKVGEYVRGLLTLMIAVGLMTWVSLSLLNVPYALSLGIIAGVLEAIPLIGPIIATLPAIIVALTISPWLALGILVLYIVIQRVESILLYPLILGKALDMPPLVIIVVLLMAGVTLGFKGVLLSPAIAAVMYVFVQEFYLKKINT